MGSYHRKNRQSVFGEEAASRYKNARLAWTPEDKLQNPLKECHFRLPDDLLQELRLEARLRVVPLTWLVTEILRDGIGPKRQEREDGGEG